MKATQKTIKTFESVREEAVWFINYRIQEANRDDISRGLFEIYHDRAFDSIHCYKMVGLITEDETTEFLLKLRDKWEA